MIIKEKNEITVQSFATHITQKWSNTTFLSLLDCGFEEKY